MDGVMRLMTWLIALYYYYYYYYCYYYYYQYYYYLGCRLPTLSVLSSYEVYGE